MQADIPPGIHELETATNSLFQVSAEMRDEGIPTPSITLLLGVNSLADNTSVEDEQLAYIASHYLHPAKYRNLWLEYLKKPLVVILNGDGPKYEANQKPLLNHDFTVRWMWTQDQQVHYEKQGYWSWMDGSLNPVATMYNNHVEALTITPAFFPPEGWLAKGAYGKLNGWTFLTQWNDAFKLRPRFLFINQWNEFAGQSGPGNGPNHNVYVDIYNSELSDDIEPTSEQLPGMRSKGGWGYYYYNLTRAAIMLYRGYTPHDTLLAMEAPLRNSTVKTNSLQLKWATLGRQPKSYNLLIDGKTVARDIKDEKYDVMLGNYRNGNHSITVLANGAYTHYPLSFNHEDIELHHPIPVKVTIPFVLAR